jgi:hypothetical protein
MSLSNKVDQFIGASDIVQMFVHADKNTDVQTQGGPVPSIAKLVDVLQKRVIEVVELQRVLQQMLAASSGAGLVKTSDGKTVQAALDGKANASGNTTQDFAAKVLYAASSVVANGANAVRISGAAAGSSPTIAAEGADTNISLDFRVKGSGEHIFRGAANAYQFVITNTAGAVNFPLVRASIAGQGVIFGAEGTDAAVAAILRSKGNAPVALQTGGRNALVAEATPNSENYAQVIPGALGQPVTIRAVGNNYDIDLVLSPKNAGSVRAPQIVCSALQIVSAAAVLGMQESDQAGATGVWRWVADGGTYRLDWNTSTGRGFATYKTPLTVNANGVLTVPTPSNEPLAVVNAEYVNSAFASLPGGAMVLLGSAIVNPATPVANIDFLNICTAAYDHYIIDVNSAANSVASALLMRVAVGGVVDSTGAIYTVPSPDTGAGNGSDRINLTPNAVTIGSGLSRAHSTVDVRNANSADPKPIGVRGQYNDSTRSNINVAVIAEGLYRGTGAISGFRFYWGAGNFTGGTIRIYGIKNA